MPFGANVYRIFVASPGDVPEEREAISGAVSEWNSVHAASKGIYLEAVRWETHSDPAMGGRPQAIINKQLLDRCDILIGVFWTRLGSPTGVAESGTAEEIDAFLASQRPVLLYFSDSPIPPNKIDPRQHAKVKKHKEKWQKNGLVEGFSSVTELASKVGKNLTRTLENIAKRPLFLDSKGICKVSSCWVGTIENKFVASQNNLSLFLKDGHSFFRDKVGPLKQRLLARGGSTCVMILHPDYEHMAAVANMDPIKRGHPDKQRADCLNSIKVMHSIRDSIKQETGSDISGAVTFRGYRAVPTWCGFIGESAAIIHLFHTRPHRGDLLTFEMTSTAVEGGSAEWYDKYALEYSELLRMTDEDYPDCDLWNFKLP
jgi:hypothetical protein